MKFSNLVVFYLFFAIFSSLYYYDDAAGQTQIVFPTFETPTLEYENVTGGCGGFIDCTEYSGRVLQNIALSVIWVVESLIELAQFIFAVLELLFDNIVSGIPGAPGWVNFVIFGLPAVAGGVMLIRLLKSGDASD